jgi:lysophospholipase L1-like esterase
MIEATTQLTMKLIDSQKQHASPHRSPARMRVLRAKYFLRCGVALLSLLALPCLAEAQSAQSAAAQVQETDARLHADGPGWRLDKARIADEKLPRVLFIGDSILQGYMGTVLSRMKGKVNADFWVTPLWQSERFNKALADVLREGPYDVIHMNIGLHGWPQGRILPGTYEPLTRAFLDVIRTSSPATKLIWANSTPTFNKQNLSEFNTEINPTIVEHNKMAAEVMKERGVPINDFYSLLVDKASLVRADGVHWNPPAMKMLAEVAVKSIFRELEKEPKAN